MPTPGAAPHDTWERHPGAASSALGRYRRREPEKTVLHAVVRDHLEGFLAAARQSGSGKGLPAHVERAFRGYLDCGILANGFARVRCPDCGFERLVAFSCKARICPSCATRRMEDAADHLVRNVLPAVPVRQWVLSLPRALRFQAARDEKVVTRLLDLFTRAVFAWQRRSARRTLASNPRTRRAEQAGRQRAEPRRGAEPQRPAPRRVEPRTGGVTFVQRFGGALNLNVHFHTLIPDGVFVVEGDAPTRFVRVAAPKDEDIERILTRAIRQIRKEFPEHESADDRTTDADDPLAALQAAEVGRRLRFPEPFKRSRRSAHLDGFSLHAGVKVHENDRQGLERLCRYAGRPPLALHRLSRGEDGRLVYKMKRPRGGALFLLLTPEELLAKLATLVPPPRSHTLRYHGVFAPNSRLRRQVVPQREVAPATPAPSMSPPELPPPTSATPVPAPPSAPQPRVAAQPSEGTEPPPTRIRVPWAELLQKVHAIDVLACPECGGRLEVIAYISQPAIAKQILDHLGVQSQAPPVAKARSAGPDEAAPGPDYDCVDPASVYDE